MMYYLGIPVQPVEEANYKGKLATEFGPGYVNALWPPAKKEPDGKIYTHWAAQLKETPYGC